MFTVIREQQLFEVHPFSLPPRPSRVGRVNFTARPGVALPRRSCPRRQLFIQQRLQVGEQRAHLVLCRLDRSLLHGLLAAPSFFTVVSGLGVLFFSGVLRVLFLHVYPVVRQGNGQGGLLVTQLRVTLERTQQGKGSVLPCDPHLQGQQWGVRSSLFP